MNARRGFLCTLVAASLAPAAHARDPVSRVGYLSNGANTAALARKLAAHGYVEGRNLRFELRVATDPQQVDALAAELVAARPHVLVAWGITNVRALARHTRTIPIVCGETADPVGLGLAKTLARPGGNITGLSAGIPEVAPILVGLMRTVRPGLRRIAVIVREDGRDARQGWGAVLGAMKAAAVEAGIEWGVEPVGSLDAIERLFDRLDPAGTMLYVLGVPRSMERAEAVQLAMRRRMACTSASADLARAGALMHYSIDHADPLARVAALVDKLLRGADPAETPFELPDRTTFIVNRATARAIGVTLPPEVLARATEVLG